MHHYYSSVGRADAVRVVHRDLRQNTSQDHSKIITRKASRNGQIRKQPKNSQKTAERTAGIRTKIAWLVSPSIVMFLKWMSRM